MSLQHPPRPLGPAPVLRRLGSRRACTLHCCLLTPSRELPHIASLSCWAPRRWPQGEAPNKSMGLSPKCPCQASEELLATIHHHHQLSVVTVKVQLQRRSSAPMTQRDCGSNWASFGPDRLYCCVRTTTTSAEGGSPTFGCCVARWLEVLVVSNITRSIGLVV
jgi:hypothetical protein